MLDARTLEELKTKHGAVADLEVEDGRVIVVRKPTGAQYTAFTGKVMKDGANRAGALSDFVRECVVYPAEAEATKILDDYPAIIGPLSGVITEMAGGSREARIRKN